jgi:hypothetical protein
VSKTVRPPDDRSDKSLRHLVLAIVIFGILLALYVFYV